MAMARDNQSSGPNSAILPGSTICSYCNGKGGEYKRFYDPGAPSSKIVDFVECLHCHGTGRLAINKDALPGTKSEDTGFIKFIKKLFTKQT